MENKRGIWKENIIFITLFVLLFVSGCQYIKNPDVADTQTPVDNYGGDEIIENASAPIPTASDSGEIEFTVLEIINKNNEEYARITVDKVISYSRDENAYYDEIKEGDVFEFYLPFGSKETDTKLNDATYGSVLSGLNNGDKLRGAIAGCPDKCNSGKGWGLFLYSSIIFVEE